MKFCTKCGAQMQDADFACAQCGMFVNQPQGAANQGYNQAYNQGYYQNYDAPSTGYAVLGFFFPMVGLILYFIEKDKTPLKAKSALKGVLWSIGISLVPVVLFFSFLFFPFLFSFRFFI